MPAAAIRHAFQSAKVDGADSGLARPSNWNAEHVVDIGAITPNLLKPSSGGSPSSMPGTLADSLGMEYIGGVELAAAANRTPAMTLGVTKDIYLVMGRVTSFSLAASPALYLGSTAEAAPTTPTASPTKYWSRNMESLAGFAVFTNAEIANSLGLKLFASTATTMLHFFFIISNRASAFKPCNWSGQIATGSAATIGKLNIGMGEYVDNANQIDKFQLGVYADTAITMGVESGFMVFGKNSP